MALPSSGQLSLNDIHVEAGGATGTLCSINDTDILGLIGKTASTTMSFSEWYGASATILLTEGDFQAISDPSITHIDADILNNNPYGPGISNGVWQFIVPQRGGHKYTISYQNTGFTFNRWVQVTSTITVTNIFNLSGVDSSATGKTIYFEHQSVNRSRLTNGSEGTASVTTRFYQSNFSTAAVSSTRQAGGIDGQVDDTYSVTTFGGTISSTNNGQAQLRIIDAVGLNYNSGSASGNDAKGMFHEIQFRTPFTTTNQNIRIE